MFQCVYAHSKKELRDGRRTGVQLDANNNEIDEISTDDESTDDDTDSGYIAVGGFHSLSDLYSEMVRTNTPPVYQRTYM